MNERLGPTTDMIASIIHNALELDRYAGHAPDTIEYTISVPIKLLTNLRKALNDAGFKSNLEDVN